MVNYRDEYLTKNTSCEVCGSKEDIEVHHIDGVRSNNSNGNLTALCQRCHRRVHQEAPVDNDELAELQRLLGKDPKNDTRKKNVKFTLPGSEVESLRSEAEEQGFGTLSAYLRHLVKNRD